MIKTSPWLRHIVEYMELTGEHREPIVAGRHLGTPSERQLRPRSPSPE